MGREAREDEEAPPLAPQEAAGPDDLRVDLAGPEPRSDNAAGSTASTGSMSSSPGQLEIFERAEALVAKLRRFGHTVKERGAARVEARAVSRGRRRAMHPWK